MNECQTHTGSQPNPFDPFNTSPTSSTPTMINFQGTGNRPNQNSPDTNFQGTATVGPVTINFNGQAKPQGSSPTYTSPSSPLTMLSPQNTNIYVVSGYGTDNVSGRCKF